MTTLVNFNPSRTAAFSFQATLDGAVYNVVILWNLFGQRYYAAVFDLGNNLVVNKPLIGSDVGFNVTALEWSSGKVTLTTSAPHGFKVGNTFDLTVSGCMPDAYNGLFSCLATSPTTLTYSLTNDPGQASVFGAVSYDISLVAGYFQSTLVYRKPSRQFEVNP